MSETISNVTTQSSNPFHHVTVLKNETVQAVLPSAELRERLRAQKNTPFVAVDCTLGGGGHSATLIEMLADSGFFQEGLRLVLLGIDRDPAAHNAARGRLAEVCARRLGASLESGNPVRFVPCHGNFGDLAQFVSLELESQGAPAGSHHLHALMADFGVSSPQLDTAARGFSLQQSGPLDMRMDPTASHTPTARDLLETLPAEELTSLFFQYGEEPKSRKLAAAICQDRQKGCLPVANTLEFAEYVKKVLSYPHSRIHPATRVFQALRIAVNGELAAIESLLATLPPLMAPGGKAAFIAFHSLEDRLVKQAVRAWEKGQGVEGPQHSLTLSVGGWQPRDAGGGTRSAAARPEARGKKEGHKKKTSAKAAWDAQQLQMLADWTAAEAGEKAAGGGSGTSAGASPASWGREAPRGGLTASESEMAANARARSARLRVFEFSTPPT